MPLFLTITRRLRKASENHFLPQSIELEGVPAVFILQISPGFPLKSLLPGAIQPLCYKGRIAIFTGKA